MRTYRADWRGPRIAGDVCPICGGPLPEHGIFVDVQARLVVIDGKPWHFPRAQIKFLSAVVQAYPGVAVLERIRFRLWGEDLKDEPMTADKAVSVHAYHIKTALRQTRYRIQNVHGEGYVLIVPPKG